MAITLYATPTDVREAFEGTIPVDAKNNARLDGLLTRASAKLSALVPSLDARMASGAVDPEIPAGMVVEAVLRVWRNPAGLTQEGIGPFQASRNANAARNEIFYDPDEVARLRDEGGVPGTFRVGYTGRQRPVDGLVDAERPLHTVMHVTGL